MSKNVLLTTLFKKYRDAIESNKDFRSALNKESIHYLKENLEDFKSQLSLVNEAREHDFNKKYKQALTVLQERGISGLTFIQISKTLREKFLDHFTELKEIGVDTGHMFSNLTMASKSKAQTEIFNTELEIRPFREIEQITGKDLNDIAKTIAIISSYTKALEELDKIQNRKDLIKFLKKSSSFKEYAKSAPLNTLEDIKSAISKTFAMPGAKGKGLAELGEQILRNTVLNIETDTTINMARSITATESGIAMTFEISAVNQFKGSIAKSIKTSFTALLDQMMEDPEGLPKILNTALEKALKQEFTKADFLRLFPNIQASKTYNEVLRDIVTSIIRGNKPSNYKAKSAPVVSKKSTNISVSASSLSPKKIRVKEQPIKEVIKKDPQLELTSIAAYINTNLAERIQQNMGAGSRSDILNYRTGRFANSVKVERMSQSREGMITAFYSYMKNPYATFSTGGKQEFPKTRDPKLLISKSIREIAATKVANRLRAVVV